jgi:hypothetical protein
MARSASEHLNFHAVPTMAVITAEVGYSTFRRPKKSRLCFA